MYIYILTFKEQAIEMKLVADKEDINRQRQKIRDKIEDINAVIFREISYSRKSKRFSESFQVAQ